VNTTFLARRIRQLAGDDIHSAVVAAALAEKHLDPDEYRALRQEFDPGWSQ
jgi:hypothetical protein